MKDERPECGEDEWMKELKVTIMDLFGAGSETTSTTLMFAVFILSRNPSIQSDLRESISGENNEAYLNAFIQETLRFSCIAYMGIPHAAKADTRIGGYEVKKGTMVTLHLWDVLRNPDYFEDPDRFRPERFLEGGEFRPDSRCVPFLTGQRSCPGKTMALQELAIFLTVLVGKFEFRAVDELEEKPFDPKEGLILTCPSFRVKCIKR